MIQTQFNIALSLITLLLASCGGTVIPTNPLKEMKEEFKDKNAYTIILSDMDLQDGQYLHKYKVFELLEGQKVATESTDWKPVDDDFFLLHEDDLGMEILSKRADGKYNNLVTPPGFTHFIGNENFGIWFALDDLSTADSSQVWLFSRDDNRIPSLEEDLGLNGLMVTKGEYDRFQEKYYLNRPFYGQQTTADSTKYGTRSWHMYYTHPAFYSRRNQKNNFDKPYRGVFPNDNRGGGGYGK